MIRGAVLEALARAALAGEDDEAALRRLRVDPVLEPLARTRLRRATLEAMLLAPRAQGADLCRRAYLGLAGEAPAEDDDADAVSARFDAVYRAAGAPPRVTYVASAAVALVCAALLSLLGLALWRAAHPAPRDAWHRPAPPPSGAFASGGVPAAVAPEAAAIFQRRLVDHLLIVDELAETAANGNPDGIAAERTRVDASAAAIVQDCPRALAPPVCARLATLLAAAAEVAAHGGTEAQDAYLAAVGGLDDELAAADVALYVDGDVITRGDGRRFVIVYSFVVEAVHVYRAAGGSGESREVRALWLRRLDGLNFEHAAAGFVRPNLREALVLLDQTEEQLVRMLPALVEDAPFALAGGDGAAAGAGAGAGDDGDGRDFEGRAALERRAGEVVRRELGAALGAEGAASVARLGDRLIRRGRSLDRLAERLDARGLVFARPSGLRMPAGWLDDLSEVVPEDELAELSALDVELSSEAAAAAFALARALLATSIEGHEVQHRLDYAAGGLRMPAEMEALVGPAQVAGEERRGAAAARDELSAYLSELARSGHLVGTNLVLLARFVLDRDHWGGAECHAALVIFAGLARELGLPGEPLIGGRRVDRAAVARTLTALLARPPADVSAAAARLWAHLYGEPLARVERR